MANSIPATYLNTDNTNVIGDNLVATGLLQGHPKSNGVSSSMSAASYRTLQYLLLLLPTLKLSRNTPIRTSSSRRVSQRLDRIVNIYSHR
jgi:hypothetical protein